MSHTDNAIVYGYQGLAREPKNFSDMEIKQGHSSATLDDKDTLSGGSYSDWVGPTIDRLSELLRLEENWDSYGARPVNPKAALFAFEILRGMMRDSTPQPWIVPTPSGHIQLEWHTKGIDLEVEVFSPTLIRVFFEDQLNHEEWEGDQTYDLSKLANVIDELTRR